MQNQRLGLRWSSCLKPLGPWRSMSRCRPAAAERQRRVCDRYGRVTSATSGDLLVLHLIDVKIEAARRSPPPARTSCRSCALFAQARKSYTQAQGDRGLKCLSGRSSPMACALPLDAVTGTGSSAKRSGPSNNTTEIDMNWDQIEGNWKQLKGKVKQQWGKLTDDDLDELDG